MEFTAKAAHADIPDEECGEANTAVSKGTCDNIILRGMLDYDSGCYPNMRRTTLAD